MNLAKRSWRPRTATVSKTAMGLLLTAIGLLLGLVAYQTSLEHFFYDRLFLLRGKTQPPPEILIVAIDEPSFQVLNQQWPWPRSMHAKLLNRLYQAGAKTVALDVVFAEPSAGTEDSALWSALLQNPTAVLAAEMSQNLTEKVELETLISPTTSVAPNGTRIGVINVPIDSDGFIREALVPALIPATLACQAALSFNPELKVGSSADTPRGRINYYGPAGSFAQISYYQALDQQTPDRLFKDKLIFVGVASTVEVSAKAGARDRYLTPFSRSDSRVMPGVEIQATLAANLLRQTTDAERLITRYPMPRVWFASIALAALSSLVFLTLRPLISTAIFAAACFAVGAIAVHLFGSQSLYVPITPLLVPSAFVFLASPFYQYAVTRRERNFIRQAFSMYLSPAVVEQLVQNPERLALGGELVDATVLFLDIAGFTSLSEKLSPPEVVALVNRCLGRLSEVVFRWDGMIDKYIGDCIMAVWGVPVGTANHATQAASAALEMQSAILALAEQEQRDHGIAFAARIGLASGPMVAGNVGGGTFFNYTVLGDTVNLASRLEAANKDYGTQILVSEETGKRLQSQFELREVATVALRGQSKQQKLYELVGARSFPSKITAGEWS